MTACDTTIRAIIFDCDGTLLDSMAAWHDLEADLAWMAGVELTPQQVSMLNGNTLEQTIEYFHTTYGVGRSSSQLLEEARGMLLESYCHRTRPRGGVRALVRNLRADGMRLAVASSSPQILLRAGLRNAGLLDAFEVVASAEDERSSKRDPAFVLSVAERLGVTPEESWCIDDSAYALKVMRRAGFSTLGIYDSDQAGSLAKLTSCADRAISTFDELDYRILKRPARTLSGRATKGATNL